jgi:hypothetical protein
MLPLLPVNNQSKRDAPDAMTTKSKTRRPRYKWTRAGRCPAPIALARPFATLVPAFLTWPDRLPQGFTGFAMRKSVLPS